MEAVAKKVEHVLVPSGLVRIAGDVPIQVYVVCLSRICRDFQNINGMACILGTLH